MKQLKQENAREINLDKFLGAISTLSYLEERKREDNIIKDV